MNTRRPGTQIQTTDFPELTPEELAEFEARALQLEALFARLDALQVYTWEFLHRQICPPPRPDKPYNW